MLTMIIMINTMIMMLTFRNVKIMTAKDNYVADGIDVGHGSRAGC